MIERFVVDHVCCDWYESSGHGYQLYISEEFYDVWGGIVALKDMVGTVITVVDGDVEGRYYVEKVHDSGYSLHFQLQPTGDDNG